MEFKKDIAVIGGGPGGYVAAIRAAQLGKTVVLFEREAVGGTCMNWGCIPTKHLLHQTKILRELRTGKTFDGPVGEIVLNWPRVQSEKQKVVDRLVRGVEFLLQRYGIELVRGSAVLRDERRIVVRTKKDDEQVWEAAKIILASGSRSSELPFLKIDGTEILSSTEALALASPPKSLLVVGAGAIGLEMGTIYSRLGTEVTVLEIMPTVLPGCDREMGQRFELILKKQGLKVLTQSRLESGERFEGRVVLKGMNLKTNAPFEFTAEKVLLATGRRPLAEAAGFFEGAHALILNAVGHAAADCTARAIIHAVLKARTLAGIPAFGDLPER